MGNIFYFSFVTPDEISARQHYQTSVDEIKRIESLLTTFSEESITNKINRSAGEEAIWVDKEVFDLIKRSLQISKLTQGAFDISYGSIDKNLWNFNTHMTVLPDATRAKQSVQLIDYRNIILDEERQTVFLKKKGMRIGFGGIGKGYAAEKVKAILKRDHVYGGVINASGDLTTWGRQANGKPWTIGIAAPHLKVPFSALEIEECAVATSGNYEKFAVINGKKYSHTIDPKTGFPVEGIAGVTVICENAELADALTTPIMVMGIKAGLHMINQMKGIHCIIIDEENNMFASKNIHINYAQPSSI